MKHLFDPLGRRALEIVMQAAPLVAFDFDGTLAAIAARPDDVRVAAGISQRLAKLATLRPVAIVTGRSVEDVTPRLGFAPQYIVGNHGAEGAFGVDPAHAARLLAPVRARIRAQATALVHAGVDVEDKGLSLALHYRLARDRPAALRAIGELLAGLDPALEVFGGKLVVNVVVADAPDKGDALVALVARSGVRAAVFVGDDLNDEPVFERAPPEWLTVRIGRDHAQSQARYFLDSHAEVGTLLQLMLESLR